MILQVIFTMSHSHTFVERGFSLNKNILAENMEKLTIQSRRLIKDHLFSSKLSPHSLDMSNKILQHVKNSRQRHDNHLQENRDKKQQHAKNEQKSIVESEIKDIKGKMQDVQKIIKGLGEIFFDFVEDAKKKKGFLLLSAENALKRKDEEAKQDMAKLEETSISLKKKRRSI